MGGLAPRKFKSQRDCSPLEAPSSLFQASAGIQQLTGEDSISSRRACDILVAINLWRRGPSWSAKMARSFAATDNSTLPHVNSTLSGPLSQAVPTRKSPSSFPSMIESTLFAVGKGLCDVASRSQGVDQTLLKVHLRTIG